MKKKYDYTNKKYGYLTVIKYSHSDGKSAWWHVRCECGKERLMRSQNFRNDRNMSCGCHRGKRGKNSHTFKGAGELGASFLSHIKSHAKVRGITVSEELTIDYLWELFQQQNRQCALSGEELIPPSNYRKDWIATTNLSLDRIDSSQDYKPGNVQWVTKTVNFMKQTLSQTDFLRLCRKITSYQEKK